MEFIDNAMILELLANHLWDQSMEYFFDIPHTTGGVKQHSRTAVMSVQMETNKAVLCNSTSILDVL